MHTDTTGFMAAPEMPGSSLESFERASHPPNKISDGQAGPARPQIRSNCCFRRLGSKHEKKLIHEREFVARKLGQEPRRDRQTVKGDFRRKRVTQTVKLHRWIQPDSSKEALQGLKGKKAKMCALKDTRINVIEPAIQQRQPNTGKCDIGRTDDDTPTRRQQGLDLF